MDIDKARQHIREHHRAMLACSRSDGRIQMTPVLAGIDAEGRVVISSRERAFKVRNLRRDPHATLCVLNDDFYGEWVQVEGRATVVSLPEAMEPLIDYYRCTAGEHSDWDEYRTAMRDQQRVVIRIDVESAGPDRAA